MNGPDTAQLGQTAVAIGNAFVERGLDVHLLVGTPYSTAYEPSARTGAWQTAVGFKAVYTMGGQGTDAYRHIAAGASLQLNGAGPIVLAQDFRDIRQGLRTGESLGTGARAAGHVVSRKFLVITLDHVSAGTLLGIFMKILTQMNSEKNYVLSFANKWAVVLVILFSVGCSRTVELKSGSLSTGEEFRLFYLKKRVPFDEGDLWIEVSRAEKTLLRERLAWGYDAYLDLKLVAAEVSPGVLVIVENREEQAWEYHSNAARVGERPFTGAPGAVAR